jgi:hypothetical protein
MTTPTEQLEDNSLLEVFFDYLKLKIPNIKIERVGDSDHRKDIGFYIVFNPSTEHFCLAGTMIPTYIDRRQKDLFKRRQKSTIFIFLNHLPKLNDLLVGKMFNDFNSGNISETEYIFPDHIDDVIDNLNFRSPSEI